MPRLVTLLFCFVLNLVFFSTFTHAWTFRWTNEEKQTRIVNGKGNRKCTTIEMRKGREYKWDPEESANCINFFADDNCTPEEKNGWSCQIYGPRNNSQPWVKSFLINENGDELPSADESTTSKTEDSTKTATSDSTATSGSETGSATPTASGSGSPAPSPSTSTSSSSPPPAVTVTAFPSPTPSEESSSLSGGGIAGAVIGSIAGVGVLVGAVFFILRRRRRARTAGETLRSETDSIVPSPHYGAHELSPTTPISPETPATIGHHHEEGLKAAQKQFIAELPANQIAEMGASRGKEQ